LLQGQVPKCGRLANLEPGCNSHSFFYKSAFNTLTVT
jgi:hypothetical protein